MIYEVAYVLRPEATEEAIKKMTTTVKDALKEFGAEILLEDAWGMKSFAQPTKSGITRGNYFYLIYKAEGKANTELERRFKISEETLKFMIVVVGVDAAAEEVLKTYKNPSQYQTPGGDMDKDRKMFSKRKSCWFSEKKTTPDWKDPSSYAWLVNEFGKISPARVTGLRPKYQRMATSAIKRGRCMGLISYMSNHVAR